MKKILVIAPHPDDETLGCGGTLLRHRTAGDHVYWLIATKLARDVGYTSKQILKRKKEICSVASRYGFKEYFQLGFRTTRLDSIPMVDLIEALSRIIGKISPQWIYVPYPRDVHTDHRAVFDAATSSAKWFRNPSIERILAYETLSETGFAFEDAGGFNPDVYINIKQFLNEKIEIMKLYQGEMESFPFPRSETAMKALAALRGAESGFKAAEAFMLLKERIS